MKFSTHFGIAIIAISFVLFSCGKQETKPAQEQASNQTTTQAEQSKVMQDLLEAFNGESNAANRYEAFAKKAEEEGYMQVAVLFRAASQAEKVHARNHEEVIKKLGGTATAKIEEPNVKTTKENLQAAIDGETYEFTKMYPEMLANAKKERSMDAVKTFNFAMEVEKLHAALYQNALNNLENMKKFTKTIYVCPVCGFTSMDKTKDPCPICATPSEKFMEFKFTPKGK